MLLRTAVQALANRPVNLILLAGLGRNLDKLGLGPLPANIRLDRGRPSAMCADRGCGRCTRGFGKGYLCNHVESADGAGTYDPR
ncbi:MAG: hypothetical protein JWO48_3084 [Bryobacterales bacterium]|nr:hypothetical protein [Bryobacterales bacterium]